MSVFQHCNTGLWYYDNNDGSCTRIHRCIKTDFVYPPIPIRTYDWVAWYDDLGEDGSPYGYGRTEQEAIADLVENYDD